MATKTSKGKRIKPEIPPAVDTPWAQKPAIDSIKDVLHQVEKRDLEARLKRINDISNIDLRYDPMVDL